MTISFFGWTLGRVPAAPGAARARVAPVCYGRPSCVFAPLFSTICTQSCRGGQESVARLPIGASIEVERALSTTQPPRDPTVWHCPRPVTETPSVSALQAAPSLNEATAVRARRAPMATTQYPRTSRAALCLLANRRTEHPRTRTRRRRRRPSSTHARQPSRQFRRSAG